MKFQTLLVLLFGMTACYGQPSKSSSISSETLGNVISCLTERLGPRGFAPKQFTSNTYLVQYFYGILTPQVEKDNELQLFVYRPNSDTADFYQVFFEGNQDKENIYIGDGGSIKKSGDHLVPDEAPGGVATYNELKKILARVEKTPSITISVSDVKPGSGECIFEP